MKVASAYDIPSKRVFTREELKEAIAEMLATDGPFLLPMIPFPSGRRFLGSFTHWYFIRHFIRDLSFLH